MLETLLDHYLALSLHAVIERSEGLQVLLIQLAEAPLAKGVVMLLPFWYLWFSHSDPVGERRTRLVAALGVFFVAIVSGRALALLLPFRARPINDAALDLGEARYLPGGTLEHWSSFPSDHAILFVAVAVCYWLIDRRAGLLAILYAVFFVLLPRVVLGLHWTSDILAGAAIGAAIALVLMRPSVALARLLPVEAAVNRFPQFVYPALFVLLYCFATLFDDVRTIGSQILKAF